MALPKFETFFNFSFFNLVSMSGSLGAHCGRVCSPPTPPLVLRDLPQTFLRTLTF